MEKKFILSFQETFFKIEMKKKKEDVDEIPSKIDKRKTLKSERFLIMKAVSFFSSNKVERYKCTKVGEKMIHVTTLLTTVKLSL